MGAGIDPRRVGAAPQARHPAEVGVWPMMVLLAVQVMPLLVPETDLTGEPPIAPGMFEETAVERSSEPAASAGAELRPSAARKCIFMAR